MSDPLRDFYLAALGAEIMNAPQTPFSAVVAAHYATMLLALEASASRPPTQDRT
jgi:hypothetical protein